MRIIENFNQQITNVDPNLSGREQLALIDAIRAFFDRDPLQRYISQLPVLERQRQLTNSEPIEVAEEEVTNQQVGKKRWGAKLFSYLSKRLKISREPTEQPTQVLSRLALNNYREFRRSANQGQVAVNQSLPQVVSYSSPNTMTVRSARVLDFDRNFLYVAQQGRDYILVIDRNRSGLRTHQLRQARNNQTDLIIDIRADSQAATTSANQSIVTKKNPYSR